MATFPTLLAAADKAAQTSLGGTVRYTPQVGAAADVKAVFDAHFRRDDALQRGVAAVGPAAFVRLADLPADPSSDVPLVTVDGVDYRVREVWKDGLGGAVLHLIKAA